jgi:8-oxo-dGTP diphosphatase
MNAEQLIDRMTETDDQSNLCVVLRPGENGIEALLVADEKGRWSIPGGHAKENETHADACKREVKEETGLDVEVEPLFLAAHAARKLPVTLFYALVEPGTEGRPGGGDVTKVRWAPTTGLGDLNGTDKLAIQVAANRVHNPQELVDTEVEVAEQLGYAVANVAAPPPKIPGIYFRLNGKASASFAHRLSEWAASLNWPTTVIGSGLFESTKSALERASKRRRLTPMLDCLLHVSDALWRYESAVAPALAQGHIVLEIGPEIDSQRLLERGLEPEVWQIIDERIPKPVAAFTVGEDFTLTEFQVLKDSIEDMKDNPAP